MAQTLGLALNHHLLGNNESDQPHSSLYLSEIALPCLLKGFESQLSEVMASASSQFGWTIVGLVTDGAPNMKAMRQIVKEKRRRAIYAYSCKAHCLILVLGNNIKEKRHKAILNKVVSGVYFHVFQTTKLFILSNVECFQKLDKPVVRSEGTNFCFLFGSSVNVGSVFGTLF